jgi:hypothetical protein
MRNSQAAFGKVLLVVLFIFPIALPALGQYYWGMGLHLGTPVRFDESSTGFLEVRSKTSTGLSVFFREDKFTEGTRGWYWEIGGSGTIIRFREVAYDEKYLSPLEIDQELRRMSIANIFLGGGILFSMRGDESLLSLGLDATTAVSSSQFTTQRMGADAEELFFPVVFRLGVGYHYRFSWFNQFPAQLELQMRLTPQNMVNGSYFLRDPILQQGYVEGRFRQNHSQIGIRLLTSLDTKKQKQPRRGGPKARDGVPIEYRISGSWQSFASTRTDYYIPQVDSFSLNSLAVNLSWQIGVQAEAFNFRNPNWMTTFGIGLGASRYTINFDALPEYITTSLGPSLQDVMKYTTVGWYLMPTIGVAYQAKLGSKTNFQHSFSTHAFLPMGKEGSTSELRDVKYLGQPSGGSTPSYLSVEVDHQFRNRWLFWGGEYRPELVFPRPGKRTFAAIGLVFNYTFGDIYRGAVTVDNERTTYYGAMVQRFSKIGVTARVGWNARRW